jgi:flagellar basal body-associated protein FliL
MWTDWLEFQKQAKAKREEARKAELRAAAARKAKLWLTLMWAAIVSLLGVLMAIGLWVVSQLKGK